MYSMVRRVGDKEISSGIECHTGREIQSLGVVARGTRSNDGSAAVVRGGIAAVELNPMVVVVHDEHVRIRVEFHRDRISQSRAGAPRNAIGSGHHASVSRSNRPLNHGVLLAVDDEESAREERPIDGKALRSVQLMSQGTGEEVARQIGSISPQHRFDFVVRVDEIVEELNSPQFADVRPSG